MTTEDEQIETHSDENWILIERACNQDREKTKYDRQNKLKIILQFLYCKFGQHRLLEYTPDQILALYEWIDKKPIQLKSKSRYRYHLKTVIMYSLKMQINDQNAFQKIALWDYILSNKYFIFKQTGEKRKILYVAPEEIKAFLQVLLQTNIEDYILFGILAYSGCRVGGLVAMQIADINFEKGLFLTQEKPTKNTTGKNTYYLPRFFLDHIQTYLDRTQKKSGKLIPLTTKAIRKRIKKHQSTWWPHLFRHTIRSNWQRKGMDKDTAELLLNHEPSSVDSGYLRSLKTDEYLREQYDKFFPY